MVHDYLGGFWGHSFDEGEKLVSVGVAGESFDRLDSHVHFDEFDFPIVAVQRDFLQAILDSVPECSFYLVADVCEGVRGTWCQVSEVVDCWTAFEHAGGGDYDAWTTSDDLFSIPWMSDWVEVF